MKSELVISGNCFTLSSVIAFPVPGSYVPGADYASVDALAIHLKIDDGDPGNGDFVSIDALKTVLYVWPVNMAAMVIGVLQHC